MIVYKKQRRKVDPVKQILARLDEKQSKSGLSLYSRSNIHESEKKDILPVVQPFTEATSTTSKSSVLFQDLSVARQNAHRRLNAGLKQSIDDSHHKSALYAKAKADRRLNQTFPPAKSNELTARVNQRRDSYAFGGWSDTPSAGVENIRNSHYTSMNPFGYNRRTLAFQPTSLNYVVEWPETWPFKIMSLGKGSRRLHKKREKVKPKVFRKVHFEGSSVRCTSPQSAKQASPEAVLAPLETQSKQVLQEMQPVQLSVGTAPLESSVSDRQKEEVQFPVHVGESKEPVSGHLLGMQDGESAERSREHSDMSSLSGSENKVEEPDQAENREAGNTTNSSSVPTCTPTPTSKGVDSKNALESEGEEGSHSQTLLMDVVSQIAGEPGPDYMRDI